MCKWIDAQRLFHTSSNEHQISCVEYKNTTITSEAGANWTYKFTCYASMLFSHSIRVSECARRNAASNPTESHRYKTNIHARVLTHLSDSCHSSCFGSFCAHMMFEIDGDSSICPPKYKPFSANHRCALQTFLVSLALAISQAISLEIIYSQDGLSKAFRQGWKIVLLLFVYSLVACKMHGLIVEPVFLFSSFPNT